MPTNQISFRTSQSFALGHPQIGPQATIVATATAQRDLMLGRYLVEEGGANPFLGGQLTAAAVNGASILTSNQPMSLWGLGANAVNAGNNFIGVPLINNGTFVTTIQLDAPAPFNTANGVVLCDPWDSSYGAVPPPDAMGSGSLSWGFGLGRVMNNAGGGAPFQLIATCIRDTVLGGFFIGSRDSGTRQVNTTAGILINSITINNTEMLANTLNATVVASAFQALAQDTDMKNLAAFVPQNSNVIVSGVNIGGASDIEAHFFCNALGT